MGTLTFPTLHIRKPTSKEVKWLAWCAQLNSKQKHQGPRARQASFNSKLMTLRPTSDHPLLLCLPKSSPSPQAQIRNHLFLLPAFSKSPELQFPMITTMTVMSHFPLSTFSWSAYPAQGPGLATAWDTRKIKTACPQSLQSDNGCTTASQIAIVNGRT